jgi:hypothetical protein
MDMGIAVLKMDKESGSELILFKDYMVQRNIEIELILEPGQYIVVPRTTGCSLKRPDNQEMEIFKLMD